MIRLSVGIEAIEDLIEDHLESCGVQIPHHFTELGGACGAILPHG